MEELQQVVTEEGSAPLEAAPQEEAVAEVQEVPEVQEELSDKEINFSKLRGKNKELQERLAQIEGKAKYFEGLEEPQIQGLSALHRWLNENEGNAQALRRLMLSAEDKPESVADEFEGYDPDTASMLRSYKTKITELEQWKNNFERSMVDQQNSTLAEKKQEIEDIFTKKLQTDGFLDKNGDPVDEDTIEAIETLTADSVKEAFQKRGYVTQVELDQAYAKAMKVMSSIEKNGLKKASSKERPVVPATGSRTGLPPSGKKSIRTDDDAIAYMNSLLGSGG